MPQRQGAIPYQIIRDMMAAGYIKGGQEEHIQPASLDLTITDEIYRMRGSYLPRTGEPIRAILEKGALFKHHVDRPLEHNGIYLIKLAETLELPPGIHATTSNKSSSGRINLRGRLITDGVPRFDDVPAGYRGTLWIEVIPKSFPVLLHPGDRVNQMRFFHGDARLTALEHRIAFDRYGLLRDSDGNRVPTNDEYVGKGITMTIDLLSRDIIGWRAKTAISAILDTARFDHDPEDFFEPVFHPKSDELVLHPDTFFILATKERILVPPDMACEMAAYDASKGEFRSHFAGFFDPGWGWHTDDRQRGTIGVLEVEVYSHDFVLRDGQPICLMVNEHMIAPPEKLYGQDLKSHYSAQQGPRLAKWFRTK
jgi:dCTP deaminase